MNFIAKNLGWLLLLAFFIFMLFVISSSDSSKTLSNSGAMSLSWVSVDVKDESDSWLQELVEKINIDNDEEVVSEIVSNEVVDLEDVEKEDKEWFFSRIFSRTGQTKEEWENNQLSGSWDALVDSKSNSSTWETKDSKEARKDIENKGEEKNIEVGIESTENLIVESTSQSQKNHSGMSLKKNNSSKEISYDYTLVKKYVPEVLGLDFPGVNIETQVGNNYEVWVHSLKINNKNFNKKLGYLMKGDVITQLTPENSYGCFQIKVLRSSVNESNWKTWYVCKKYLSETSETHEMQVSDSTKKEISIVENSEVSVTQSIEHPTTIGDVITVERSGIRLANIVLTSWDVLDQMSETNQYGCFTARVHMSVNIESVWRVGKVCNAQLY